MICVNISSTSLHIPLLTKLPHKTVQCHFFLKIFVNGYCLGCHVTICTIVQHVCKHIWLIYHIYGTLYIADSKIIIKKPLPWSPHISLNICLRCVSDYLCITRMCIFIVQVCKCLCFHCGFLLSIIIRVNIAPRG